MIGIFKKVFKLPKKYLIAGLIVIALPGFFIFRSQNTKTPKLQFASVKKMDIKSSVSSSGNLVGKNVANLKFKSSGKLAYINVSAGDKVEKYQTIAGLDTQDLAIALQQAQNTYRDKQAIAQKIEDDVKDHSSDESFAQRTTRTTAQAARDSAYDGIKAAQRAFLDAVIISPIEGIVTQAIPLSGQNVSSSDLIAQIVDITEVYFNTDVDEADISKVSLGLSSEITLDAYPNRIFKGVVDQILPQTKTTSSGATVVTVRIKLSNPPTNFVAGLSGQSLIITQTSPNALTIPQESLREDNTVVISQDKKLIEKKVEVGISSDTDVEVKKGLTENDKVLLNPPATGTKLN